jgi:hypothetical protein
MGKDAYKMRFYIVWNDAKTDGFVTNEKQLAYEVRKGAESNCYREDGTISLTGIQFLNEFCDDNCSIEEIEI